MAHDTLLGACRHLCVEETWHQTSLHQYDPCFQAQQWQHRVVGMLFCDRGQETSEDRRKNIHKSLLAIFLWRGRYVRQLWRFIFNKTMTTSKTHMEWFTPGITSWETEKCLYTDTSAQPLQAWAVQGEWRKLETEECKLVWSFPRKTVIAAKATLAMTLVKSLISRKNVILFYYFPINVQNILKITFACHCLVFKCTIFM